MVHSCHRFLQTLTCGFNQQVLAPDGFVFAVGVPGVTVGSIVRKYSKIHSLYLQAFIIPMGSMMLEYVPTFTSKMDQFCR